MIHDKSETCSLINRCKRSLVASRVFSKCNRIKGHVPMFHKQKEGGGGKVSAIVTKLKLCNYVIKIFIWIMKIGMKLGVC